MSFLSDVMFWREAITVGAFLLFCWVCKWAYSAKRAREFDEINKQLLNDVD